MYTLGIDIGSSSVKVSLLDITTNSTLADAQSPNVEMLISAPHKGWAEQHPSLWLEHLQKAIKKLATSYDLKLVKAIGISYQMHGLVLVDEEGEVLRPSIIWCDSRAVEIGNEAFEALGGAYCIKELLNSPGNFTASKLKWVKENEPDIYSRIHKIVLPGDYIALYLTGQLSTTVSGLSEGIFWNFKEEAIAKELLDHYGINEDLLPKVVPTFSNQGGVSSKIALEYGLTVDTPVTYRAGDQPNNAFSLNVLKPGEFAATAGTSGVVYGVTDKVEPDEKSRVNTFVHVNHTSKERRLGKLLCINATGIANAWIKRNIAPELSYPQVNEEAATVSIGANELVFYPFGNGAERMLENKKIGAGFKHLDFNQHQRPHMLRAVQEGIAFSFAYGMKLMEKQEIKVIRVGNANLFLSEIFTNTLAGVTGATIEFYNTDGATGAARGAALGAEIYTSTEDTFAGLTKLKVVEMTKEEQQPYMDAYQNWVANFEDIK